MGRNKNFQNSLKFKQEAITGVSNKRTHSSGEREKQELIFLNLRRSFAPIDVQFVGFNRVQIKPTKKERRLDVDIKSKFALNPKISHENDWPL